MYVCVYVDIKRGNKSTPTKGRERTGSNCTFPRARSSAWCALTASEYTIYYPLKAVCTQKEKRKEGRVREPTWEHNALSTLGIRAFRFKAYGPFDSRHNALSTQGIMPFRLKAYGPFD